MKNKIIAGVIILIIIIFGIIILNLNNTNNAKGEDELINKKHSKNLVNDNYLGSSANGNYVWGGAMNLAWNELSEKIIKEEIKFASREEKVQKMVKALNNPPFSRNDLDEESYYIKASYGQKTVDEINRESKKKFPSKSFEDLKINLSSTGIISYAYFLKEIEYETAFKKWDIGFNDDVVKGFKTSGKKQKEQIKILDYKNDDKFIIKIDLKDKNDEIFLAKGYDVEKPKDVILEINKKNKNNLPSLEEIDYFSAPKIHLDYHRDYVELINKFLANKDFEKYKISQMFENIKFDMDEKGARVENEAVIAGDISGVFNPKTPKPKYFELNKPYWIIMKRKNSKNPYFVLGINNTKLMTLVKKN